MSVTARFALPLLAAGQAQKEMTHNEALTLIDALVQPWVDSVGDNVPPADPEPGKCWIVGAAPTGDWAGSALALAIWSDGGWRFIPAREGMVVALRPDGMTARLVGGTWQVGGVHATDFIVNGDRVVGARQPAIDGPSGGMVIDVAARTAINGVIEALRAHGLIAADEL